MFKFILCKLDLVKGSEHRVALSKLQTTTAKLQTITAEIEYGSKFSTASYQQIHVEDGRFVVLHDNCLVTVNRNTGTAVLLGERNNIVMVGN